MYGIKGTIPATVKSSEGSSDIRDALGTTTWFLDSKKASQRRLISAVFNFAYFLVDFAAALGAALGAVLAVTDLRAAGAVFFT